MSTAIGSAASPTNRQLSSHQMLAIARAVGSVDAAVRTKSTPNSSPLPITHRSPPSRAAPTRPSSMIAARRSWMVSMPCPNTSSSPTACAAPDSAARSSFSVLPPVDSTPATSTPLAAAATIPTATSTPSSRTACRPAPHQRCTSIGSTNTIAPTRIAGCRAR